jgi:hypothetical protein
MSESRNPSQDKVEAFPHLKQLDPSWFTAVQWASKKPLKVLRIVEWPENAKEAQERREVLRKLRYRREEVG